MITHLAREYQCVALPPLRRRAETLQVDAVWKHGDRGQGTGDRGQPVQCLLVRIGRDEHASELLCEPAFEAACARQLEQGHGACAEAAAARAGLLKQVADAVHAVPNGRRKSLQSQRVACAAQMLKTAMDNRRTGPPDLTSSSGCAFERPWGKAFIHNASRSRTVAFRDTNGPRALDNCAPFRRGAHHDGRLRREQETSLRETRKNKTRSLKA